MTNPSTPALSGCHHAPMHIGGDDREGMHYYVCEECGRPCDPAATSTPADAASEGVREQLEEKLLLALLRAKVSLNDVGGWHFELPDDALDEAISLIHHHDQRIIAEAERSARIEGRKDAIRCSSAIEQEWRSYRGSSSYMAVALQVIEEAALTASPQQPKPLEEK